MITDVFCFGKRNRRFRFAKPVPRGILRREARRVDHEIFHKEPLRPAADGRAGPLRTGTTVSLKEVSERQNLSLKYLEQIVTPLARVGLVKSERGSQGGYRLTKAPADYTAGEILRAIEGSVAPSPALAARPTSAPCPSSASPCRSGPDWTR